MTALKIDGGRGEGSTNHAILQYFLISVAYHNVKTIKEQKGSTNHLSVLLIMFWELLAQKIVSVSFQKHFTYSCGGMMDSMRTVVLNL